MQGWRGHWLPIQETNALASFVATKYPNSTPFPPPEFLEEISVYRGKTNITNMAISFFQLTLGSLVDFLSSKLGKA